MIGWGVYFEGAPISANILMQKKSALYVAEVELMSAVSCEQDILYESRILTSLYLKLKFPILIDIDNTVKVYLINNWSVGGRTRNVETHQLFLCQMKELEGFG